MPWRNFQSPEFRTKFQREVPLFLEITEFPFNTVNAGRVKETHMPKTSSIRSSVLIKHRFDKTPTCDRRTQTQAHGQYRGCIASHGKNQRILSQRKKVFHSVNLKAVDAMLSIASMMRNSAESVPIVKSVPQKSLSIEPTIPTMFRWAHWLAFSAETFSVGTIMPDYWRKLLESTAGVYTSTAVYW